MNYVDLHRAMLLDQNFRHCQVLYKCKDGGTTTDVEKAALDCYNQPVTCGYSEKDFIPHSDYTKRQSLSFNPADPLARERAFLARDSMLTLQSVPNDYTDKFDALVRINHAADAFASNYKQTLKQVINQPAPAPAAPAQTIPNNDE